LELLLLLFFIWLLLLQELHKPRLQHAAGVADISD